MESERADRRQRNHHELRSNLRSDPDRQSIRRAVPRSQRGMRGRRRRHRRWSRFDMPDDQYEQSQLERRPDSPRRLSWRSNRPRRLHAFEGARRLRPVRDDADLASMADVRRLPCSACRGLYEFLTDAAQRRTKRSRMAAGPSPSVRRRARPRHREAANGGFRWRSPPALRLWRARSPRMAIVLAAEQVEVSSKRGEDRTLLRIAKLRRLPLAPAPQIDQDA